MVRRLVLPATFHQEENKMNCEQLEKDVRWQGYIITFMLVAGLLGSIAGMMDSRRINKLEAQMKAAEQNAFYALERHCKCSPDNYCHCEKDGKVCGCRKECLCTKEGYCCEGAKKCCPQDKECEKCPPKKIEKP
jgi:hypothetical protein